MKLHTLLYSATRLGGILRRQAVSSAHPADTLTAEDLGATRYQEGNGIDPSVLPSFVSSWSFRFPELDAQFHAQPLVYMSSQGRQQIVYLFSEQNVVYAVSAQDGTLVAKRSLKDNANDTPYVPANTSSKVCPSYFNTTMGITGTPVVDARSDTIYFWAKGYQHNVSAGTLDGVYRFYAIDALTLQDRPNYPVTIEGISASNSNRTFVSNPLVQRSAVRLVGSVVYAEFALLCDDGKSPAEDNSWVVGMLTTSGKPVVALSTSAGWWGSGSSLVFEGPSHFFIAGRRNISSYSISETGTAAMLRTWDPYTNTSMSSGRARDSAFTISLLPFASSVATRLLAAVNRNHKMAIYNADALGLPNAVAQTMGLVGKLSGPGSFATYNREGGYVYYTAPGGPTCAYMLGTNSELTPKLSLSGCSTSLANGSASMVVTAYPSLAGTGIVWVTDDSGVRAFRAVPDYGMLIPIDTTQLATPSKFQRPVFGDGVFFILAKRELITYGPDPMNPIYCAGPLDLGNLHVDETRTANITCNAINDVTIQGVQSSNKYFSIVESSIPRGIVPARTSFALSLQFKMPATNGTSNGTVFGRGALDMAIGKNLFQSHEKSQLLWTRTNHSRSLIDPALAPGFKSATVTILTNHGSINGFSVAANARTHSAFLWTSPDTVNFAPLWVLPDNGPMHSSFRIENRGETTLEIYGFSYAKTDGSGWTNITTPGSDGLFSLDDQGVFKASSLPMNSYLAGVSGGTVVDVQFAAVRADHYTSIIAVATSGGIGYLMLNATAMTAPVAQVAYQLNTAATINATSTSVDSCVDGSVTCNVQIDFGISDGGDLMKPFVNMSIANMGSGDMQVVKSDWQGNFSVIRPVDGGLANGTVIPSQNAIANIVAFNPSLNRSPGDTPVVYSAMWTVGLNDPGWGQHTFHFYATLVPPTSSDPATVTQVQTVTVSSATTLSAATVTTTAVSTSTSTTASSTATVTQEIQVPVPVTATKEVQIPVTVIQAGQSITTTVTQEGLPATTVTQGPVSTRTLPQWIVFTQTVPSVSTVVSYRSTTVSGSLSTTTATETAITTDTVPLLWTPTTILTTMTIMPKFTTVTTTNIRGNLVTMTQIIPGPKIVSTTTTVSTATSVLTTTAVTSSVSTTTSVAYSVSTVTTTEVSWSYITVTVSNNNTSTPLTSAIPFNATTSATSLTSSASINSTLSDSSTAVTSTDVSSSSLTTDVSSTAVSSTEITSASLSSATVSSTDVSSSSLSTDVSSTDQSSTISSSTDVSSTAMSSTDVFSTPLSSPSDTMTTTSSQPPMSTPPSSTSTVTTSPPYTNASLPATTSMLTLSSSTTSSTLLTNTSVLAFRRAAASSSVAPALEPNSFFSSILGMDIPASVASVSSVLPFSADVPTLPAASSDLTATVPFAVGSVATPVENMPLSRTTQAANRENVALPRRPAPWKLI